MLFDLNSGVVNAYIGFFFLRIASVSLTPQRSITLTQLKIVSDAIGQLPLFPIYTVCRWNKVTLTHVS